MSVSKDDGAHRLRRDLRIIAQVAYLYEHVPLDARKADKTALRLLSRVHTAARKFQETYGRKNLKLHLGKQVEHVAGVYRLLLKGEIAQSEVVPKIALYFGQTELTNLKTFKVFNMRKAKIRTLQGAKVAAIHAVSDYYRLPGSRRRKGSKLYGSRQLYKITKQLDSLEEAVKNRAFGKIVTDTELERWFRESVIGKPQ